MPADSRGGTGYGVSLGYEPAGIIRCAERGRQLRGAG